MAVAQQRTETETPKQLARKSGAILVRVGSLERQRTTLAPRDGDSNRRRGAD
eukprot:CAMPEP_0204540700 /NCGR_PEP_ID=MMETSP0661-20131031/17683_1 /ASSEMBLY_ACC=CAM_ASM_000606 /TAXON_ID=109239 /ORGANISM="Alexandrium margalefi, Strain AMGDE01CS-322" /LENGTH=51 /DNA_ID=CAMNT_0051547357 /DNA_START=55 /DNA_END=207 /DNA_ORIENTATION=+